MINSSCVFIHFFFSVAETIFEPRTSQQSAQYVCVCVCLCLCILEVNFFVCNEEAVLCLIFKDN